ncbi:MAG TPA: FHA domain-containing protein [Verrucomicrobiae bacterium]|jgi:hypothetical protein
MIQLQVLSGRKTGTAFQPPRLPCTIGRLADSSLQLDDAGIWDRHLELDVQFDQGVRLRLCPPALATVNGQSFDEVVLRNGDVIEAGPVKLRFWLAEPTQRSLRLREALTWVALGYLCLLQLIIIYALMR